MGHGGGMGASDGLWWEAAGGVFVQVGDGAGIRVVGHLDPLFEGLLGGGLLEIFLFFVLLRLQD